jgi:6-phospho-beta-glucosidase
LSWTRVLIDGEDRTDELIEIIVHHPDFRAISGYAFAPERLRSLGLIPSGYLRYYYDTDKMVHELQQAPQTRGERVRDVEAKLLEQYADVNLREKPAGLQERGGAWYSTAAVRLIHDLWSETGGRHILNVPNAGAMSVLPPDVVVEVPTTVTSHRIVCQAVVSGEPPTVVGYRIPDDVIHLIKRVKTYELLTVDAAVSGSRLKAVEALEAHPLLDGRHDIIPQLLDELLTAHRNYLPQFMSPE